MRAHQRKAILVILNLLNRNLPSLDGVALLTAGAELAFVNVGVAIRAFRPDVAENQFRMTGGAGHLLVHAAQRIPGLVMIELRDTADGLPTAESVTILARNVQRPVRTMRRLTTLLS